MPKIQAHPFDAANVASKLPRPLQRPGGMVLEGLKQAFGGDDPSSVMPSPGPMGGPLVSIYSNPADRMAATDAFKLAAQKLGSAYGDAAEWLTAKYPRIAAHMQLPTEFIKGTHAAHVSTPMIGGVKSPIPMNITHLGNSLVEENPAYARDIFAHEGTHVAQALGNKDLPKLYRLADSAVGNVMNPFERTAYRRGAAAYIGSYKPSRPTISALRELERMGSDPNLAQGKQMDEILRARRMASDWEPK